MDGKSATAYYGSEGFSDMADQSQKTAKSTVSAVRAADAAKAGGDLARTVMSGGKYRGMMPDQDQQAANPATVFEALVARAISDQTAFYKALYASVKVAADLFGENLTTSKPIPDQIENEALALMDTFDGRLADAEERIDRVLARLNVE